MQVLQGEQREDDRGQPAWAEPADERHAETVEAGAEQRQRNRRQPDDSEAEHRVADDWPPDPLADRRHGSAPKISHETMDAEVAGLLDEVDLPFSPPRPAVAPNTSPLTNAATNPLPSTSTAPA